MRLISLVLAILAVAAFTTFAEAKNCKKGQPCGNSCISWNKTCRIGSYQAPRLTARPSNFYSAPKPSVSPAAPAKAQLISPPADNTMTSVANPEVMYAQTDAAFVMDLPSRAANKIRRLVFGEKVEVYEVLSGWARIIPRSRTEQWVQLIYLGKGRP